MSIKQLVNDAAYLAGQGRHLGALSILMIAIAGSAKKRFPRKDGDRDKFESFLGARIASLISGQIKADDVGPSGVYLTFRGNNHLIEHILYKFYRNTLVHEAELPKDVAFVPRSDSPHLQYTISHNGESAGAGIEGDTLVFDSGWISLLIKAVVLAKINGDEFGVEHFELVPTGENEPLHLASVTEKYGLTPGRVEILKNVLESITPEIIKEIDDVELVSRFKSLVDSDIIFGGMLSGLFSRGLTDENDVLLPKGVQALRDLAPGYAWVRMT